MAVLWNAANPYSALAFKETVSAARTLGIELQSLEVREPSDFGGVLDVASAQHIDALITVEDPLTIDHRGKSRNSRLVKDCQRFPASGLLWMPGG